MDPYPEEKIAGFVSITGSTESTAKFYLDSAQGDVAIAVDHFFTGGGSREADEDLKELDFAVPGQRPQQTHPPHSAREEHLQRPKAVAQALESSRRGDNKRITGFRDLPDSEEESDSDNQNEYYTGGEKSGMVVKGGDGKPGRSKQGDVDAYFDRLEEAGARRGRPEDLAKNRMGENTVFTGRVRRLGDEGVSEEVVSRNGPTADAVHPREHTITFWRNNVFTVNGGEARDMLDPVNRSFLEAISRGEAPQELLGLGPSADIQVNCVRSNNDYKAPSRSIAFTGRGQTLSGQESSQRATPAPPIQSTATLSREWKGIDASQPSTSVQLRLADGSRMVAQFNRNHTVADIRRFIAASRPDLRGDYSLMTAFPSAALADDCATLEAAGLLNAVIIQKTN